jgi:RNA polymerase sigma factor (sigma-70 family)
MGLTLGMACMAPACSEHDLIAAARDGNDRAFEELYSRYSGRITAFINGRVRDHGRAEDVAQEVFISALRRLRASDQAIAFKPWIYEIAKNACIDEHRRSQRSREISLDADDDLSGGRRALLSVAPTPAVAAERKQQLVDLQGAFGGLSDNHHELLVMRELAGMSYDEIGERTGMSRQMVESSLFRARRKLTQEYDELASGRRCEQVQSAIADGRLVSGRTLGVRERRQFARHLSHCQACRIQARVAGVDESFVQPRTIRAKIAALLPIPFLRWPWQSGRLAAIRSGSHASSSLPALTGAAEPAGASAFGGAAAAVAALALAGAGTGLIASQPAAAHHPAMRASQVTEAAYTTGPAAMRAGGMAKVLTPAAAAGLQAARLSSPHKLTGFSSTPADPERSTSSTHKGASTGGRASGGPAATRQPGARSPLLPVSHPVNTGTPAGRVPSLPKTIAGAARSVENTAGSVTKPATKTVQQTLSSLSSAGNSIAAGVGGAIKRITAQLP